MSRLFCWSKMTIEGSRRQDMFLPFLDRELFCSTHPHSTSPNVLLRNIDHLYKRIYQDGHNSC
jgi:hypothetical protein